MKKLINDPNNYVDQSLEGMIAAHPKIYRFGSSSPRVIARCVRKPEGKVGIVSGGGFGHIPLFAGYVGRGLLDSCAVGDVFAGPAGNDVKAALEEADQGSGVLSVLGNYGGDKMTFEMQSELIRASGIDAEIVIVNDDVASAEPQEADKRRGVAGVVLVFKIAGAAAEAGLSLQEVKRLAQKAIANVRSIGVALRACTIPQVGKPTFDLGPDQVEMGMGIHGERGVWRGPLTNANALADEIVDRLLEDLPLKSGDQSAILCNSLGATPIEEIYILYRRIAQRFKDLEVNLVAPKTGHYATSMEMAGSSVTLMKLDDELCSFLLANANCPFWENVP